MVLVFCMSVILAKQYAYLKKLSATVKEIWTGKRLQIKYLAESQAGD